MLVEDVNQKKHSTVIDLIKYHRGVTGKQTSIQLEDGTRITLKKSRGDTFYMHSGSFCPHGLFRVPNYSVNAWLCMRYVKSPFTLYGDFHCFDHHKLSPMLSHDAARSDF